MKYGVLRLKVKTFSLKYIAALSVRLSTFLRNATCEQMLTHVLCMPLGHLSKVLSDEITVYERILLPWLEESFQPCRPSHRLNTSSSSHLQSRMPRYSCNSSLGALFHTFVCGLLTNIINRSVPTHDQILVPETLLKKRKSQEKAREERSAELEKKKKVCRIPLLLCEGQDMTMVMHNTIFATRHLGVGAVA